MLKYTHTYFTVRPKRTKIGCQKGIIDFIRTCHTVALAKRIYSDYLQKC